MRNPIFGRGLPSNHVLSNEPRGGSLAFASTGTISSESPKLSKPRLLNDSATCMATNMEVVSRNEIEDGR